jgi:hypothetical protein
MLPVILAAVGGYLVYDSLKAKKFADGGTIDNDYKRNKLLKYIETKSLDKNINGFEFDKENKMGGFLWRNKKMPEVKIYATPFYNSPNGIDYEEIVNSILVKAQDKKYKLTGDLEKDAKTYFDFVESVTKKEKFDIVADEDEEMDSDGQTDKELYDALKDMGYNFGKYGTSKFDEDGFSEMAVNLGYRWDEKKKVWHNKNMMADGGQTFNDSEADDFYEDLQVYVQGKGSIYKGKSLKEATEAFDDYYAKHPHAEIVMVDEKYGDELKWANVESDNDDEEYRRGGRTKAEITADKRYKALKAGKRVSEDGNVYYESRANRSDVSRRDKLADGGMMAKGGNVRSLSSGIRKYYVEAYPEDDMGADINPKATFKGLLKTLEDKKNVYTYLDVSDSLVRERVFGELSEIMGVKYSKIYNMWLLGDDD